MRIFDTISGTGTRTAAAADVSTAMPAMSAGCPGHAGEHAGRGGYIPDRRPGQGRKAGGIEIWPHPGIRRGIRPGIPWDSPRDSMQPDGTPRIATQQHSAGGNGATITQNTREGRETP